jgi:hypothetical protein
MLCRRSGASLGLFKGWSISAFPKKAGRAMNGIIYIIGLIVVVVFILGFLGLR